MPSNCFVLLLLLQAIDEFKHFFFTNNIFQFFTVMMCCSCCCRQTFAERQGNTNIGGKTMGGKYLSTVGVDVSEWTYCKKKSKYGKVTFSTWDFGGQVSNGSVSYL